MEDRKKYIIIVTGLIILLVLAALLAWLTRSGRPQDQRPDQRKPSTDSVIITDVIPANGSINISPLTTITIRFSSPIHADDLDGSISSIPITEGSHTLSSDGMQLTYHPNRPLDPETTYDFSFRYGAITDQFSFTTTANESLTQEEIAEIQITSDKVFAETQEAVHRAYPWFSKLPLQHPQGTYFAYFDLQLKKIVATTYGVPTSELEATRQTMRTQLEAMGIDLSVVEIVWETK